MSSVLKTERLQVGYGKRIVVEGIDVEGMQGQMVCIIGPNGAGKTTILRTLSGLLAPMGGIVKIRGEAIEKIHAKTLSKTLSVVLTGKLGCGLMTAFEVVAMGRHPYTNHFGKLSEKDTDIVISALETVHGFHLAQRYFEELSDGEKQKILVARALAQEPKLIILDEPTTHLDIRHRLELLDILKHLSKEKGISVILSLHEIDMALKSADKVILVKEGRIVEYGDPESVVTEEVVNDLYDIQEANFNHLIGAVELSNRKEPRVFVIGGAGCGTPIYRQLSKYQIGVATGILHKNDVDYEIARTIGMTLQWEEPFNAITQQSVKQAEECIDKVTLVVDAGSPLGITNQRNMELVEYACSIGKPIFSLRSPSGGSRRMNQGEEKIQYFKTRGIMMDNIKALLDPTIK